ncbi:hypothetical protein L914_12402 [Phytophthora nicotianae]|uniref:Uncharacterized protein n=1 Tax=Phytophthora nicotianae TaxID=4792 RepID=W2MZM3_PHYNI|nr:hypothetical protein L914_12402 [Phytophthora nicotianae]
MDSQFEPPYFAILFSKAALATSIKAYRKGRILDEKRAEYSTKENVRYYVQNLSTAILKLNFVDNSALI